MKDSLKSLYKCLYLAPVISILLTANTLYAQTSVGFRVGPSVSKSIMPGAIAKNGVDYGIYVSAATLVKNLNFQAELMLTGFASQYRLTGTGTGPGSTWWQGEYVSDISYNLRYLTIPVLARYNFGEGKLRGNVQAGPCFSFATGGWSHAHTVWANGTVTDNHTTGSDILGGGHINPMLPCVMAGIGVSYHLGNNAIFADVRGNYALRPTTMLYTSQNDNTKAVTLTVGYQYTFVNAVWGILKKQH